MIKKKNKTILCFCFLANCFPVTKILNGFGWSVRSEKISTEENYFPEVSLWQQWTQHSAADQVLWIFLEDQCAELSHLGFKQQRIVPKFLAGQHKKKLGMFCGEFFSIYDSS